MANTAPDALIVDLQIVSGAAGLPTEDDIADCLQRAATEAGRAPGAEVSVRIVDGAEIRELNHRYRGKDAETNVLAFPAELDALPGLPAKQRPLLGDLVICAPVVEREAVEQGKALRAHWCHMLVHGMLHLLGYDHQSEQEALHMEALEIRVLARQGIDNPYKIKQLS